MTSALFQVAAEPKTIHSKADICPGSLYLLFLARDSSVQETFDLLSTPPTGMVASCAHAASRSEYE